MSRQLRTFGMSIEGFQDLLHGDLFQLKGIPADGIVRQITYDYSSHAINLLIQSIEFPPTPQGEIIPSGGWIEVITYRKLK